MNINATLPGGECPRTFILDGRIGQTLYALHTAGQDGITPLDNPARRLAHLWRHAQRSFRSRKSRP